MFVRGVVHGWRTKEEQGLQIGRISAQPVWTQAQGLGNSEVVVDRFSTNAFWNNLLQYIQSWVHSCKISGARGPCSWYQECNLYGSTFRSMSVDVWVWSSYLQGSIS